VIDPLSLDSQLCFPLYACAKEIVKKYAPFLDAIGLTYTQYITMMALWERKELSVKELGEKLFLDSGTLSPVLKRLEAAGLVTRSRSAQDERVLIVSITQQGESLRDKALDIPAKMGACVNISPEDATALHALLCKLLRQMR
jgi:DNA-binding MarR family transcriptional regulator